MSNHISHNDMIAYYCETLSSRDRERVSKHLRTCTTCRNSYQTIQTMPSPVSNTITAPDSLKNRVIAGYHQLANEKNHTLAKKTGTPTFVFKRLSWALVPLVLISLFLVKTRQHHEPVNLTIAPVTGQCKINNVVAQKACAITTGDSITVPADSFAVIRYNELKIMLAEHTTISIIRARQERNIPSVAFNVLQGKIISHHQGKQRLIYTYITPQGKITPVGTQFLLTVSQQESSVIVREGSVAIERYDSTVLSRTSVKYVLSHSALEEKNISDSDTIAYNSLLQGKNYQETGNHHKSRIAAESHQKPDRQLQKTKTGKQTHDMKQDRRELRKLQQESRRFKRQSKGNNKR